MSGELISFLTAFIGVAAFGIFIFNLKKGTFESEVQAKTETSPESQLGEASPYPILILKNNGEKKWSNSSAEKYAFDSWPIEVLISKNEKLSIRAPLKDFEGNQSWFRFEKMDLRGHKAVFATPADFEIAAEDSRRDFVMTLTKTFAQLSTGLAIFDKNRHLVLFNPALLNLTNTSFKELSKRPSLSAFLDLLRRGGVVPEPKNYSHWRNKLANLEIDAQGEAYSECWSLSSGETYKITGRPHPDGSIAILFEDVSKEVKTARNYNRQVLKYRDIGKHSSLPFVVFSADFTVSFANDAYSKFWGQSFESTFASVSIQDCVKVWKKKTHTAEAWAKIEDFIRDGSQSQSFETDLSMSNGENMKVKIRRLPYRRTQVEFFQSSLISFAEEPLFVNCINSA